MNCSKARLGGRQVRPLDDPQNVNRKVLQLHANQTPLGAFLRLSYLSAALGSRGFLSFTVGITVPCRSPGPRLRNGTVIPTRGSPFLGDPLIQEGSFKGFRGGLRYAIAVGAGGSGFVGFPGLAKGEGARGGEAGHQRPLNLRHSSPHSG